MNTELITRLEAAEVGSRELDIKLALDTEHPYGFDAPEDEDNCPHYTTSIDAALALAVLVLPGWSSCLASGRSEGEFANVFPGDPNVDRVYYDAYAKTLPLALCIAILRALDAKQEDKKPKSWMDNLTDLDSLGMGFSGDR